MKVRRGTLVCLCVRWPPGLCWVCPISLQLIQQLLEKKKSHVVCFFSTSEFKSWLFLAFLCYCKLLFDTCVSTDARERGSGDSPANFHPVKLAFETFDKLICLEWSERTIFFFTFLSLSCFSCYHSPGRIGRRSGEACRKRWNALTSGTSLIFTSLCVNSYHECTTEGQSWWSWVSNDPGFTPRLEIHPGMALSCQFTLKWLTYATYNKDIPFAPTFRKEVGRGFVFSKVRVQSFFFSHPNRRSSSLLKPAGLSHLDSASESAWPTGWHQLVLFAVFVLDSDHWDTWMSHSRLWLQFKTLWRNLLCTMSSWLMKAQPGKVQVGRGVLSLTCCDCVEFKLAHL